MTHVGRSVPRKEAADKTTGRAQYVDDLVLPDMLYGITVRSSIARGAIKDIQFGGDLPWDEFTIVTAKDIPGANHVALIETDQPFLADGFINHPLEPVVLLAHPDKSLLEKARNNVVLDIEPFPAVFSIDDSLAVTEAIWGSNNVLKSFDLEKGDVDAACDDAHLVIEGTYETGAQEQLYIENQGMIAISEPDEGITVWGSMQCPYYVHKALLTLFGLPAHKARVIQTETGGGFGGKEEYPSMIAGHAALLAYKAKKPVKLTYSRSEDMAATTKRHPSRTTIRTAVDRSGKLQAIDVDFTLDGGAYATLSAVVLSRGTIHACGPYHCANTRVRSRAVATNAPPHGAFRGFGAPQSIFAIERHLDRVARELGITPEDVRRRNFITKGQKTATSQVIREDVDFDALLDRAFTESDFHAKRRRFADLNRKNPIKKGIGFATFMHGAGFTGSGEKYLASLVKIEASADGVVEVLAASTEIGQGTNTIFAQIAADALGIGYDDVVIKQPDTKFVPDSGPTVASRTCMIVGDLVQSAAHSLRDILIKGEYLEPGYTADEFKDACRKYHRNAGPLSAISEYQQPPDIEWDDEKYQGDAYATYAWAVYVAEVSVNTITYETQVDDFVAVQEVGKVIHPVLASGQIEGGVAQALGYALYEKVVWNEGAMVNNQMTNYIMPTAADVPPIRVYFEETNHEYGPGGAKGIGELPMDGPAPAILSAVENAIGVAVTRIPMLPEDLLEAVEDD